LGNVKLPQLIKKGAEASLYLADWHGRRVIIKKRLPKIYRPTVLDEQIRVYRTIHEPQLMHEAKKAGVPTPIIFQVDVVNTTIVMEFVEGKQVKVLLNEVESAERQCVSFTVGESIGKLHVHGLVHGDLTTSNMIMASDGKVFFVDFGLGEKNKELEARGVDMHLMNRALQSTHFRFAEECFDAVVNGYSRVVGDRVAKSVLDKIGEIKRRGRYVAERKSSE